jgi:hypothetical protein
MKISTGSYSSFASYKFCNFQFYLNKILQLQGGMKGKSAAQGSIIHTTLEYMSKFKKHGRTDIDPFWILDKAFDRHKHPELRRETSRGEAADYRKLKESIQTILNDKNYNPYNLDILDSEKWFELEFPGDEWLVDGQSFKMRGFIDLIHKIDEETIEIVDFKNGIKREFGSLKDKDFMALMKDIQPRLYHLVSTLLFPEYKNILTTFYYINEDGPTTLCLSNEDIITTIDFIYSFFDSVRKNKLIKRNKGWHCRMCQFNKNQVYSFSFDNFCTYQC